MKRLLVLAAFACTTIQFSVPAAAQRLQVAQCGNYLNTCLASQNVRIRDGYNVGPMKHCNFLRGCNTHAGLVRRGYYYTFYHLWRP